jgi:glycosyltransferase involved in cell wall biosynthesis
VLAGAVARGAGLATVTTVHGFTGGGWKNRVYEWLQRRAYRRYGAVIAVSRPLAERLAGAGVPRDRIHTITNAYVSPVPPHPRAEARRLLGLEGDAPVLGWVGRLSREKGADVFVRALGTLRARRWTASIVGNGRERPGLEQLAAELGVAERIVWHGTVPDAGRLYPAFDAFVLSSRTEGTPISLFEAMATYVPIVATRVGGVPDVVGDAEAAIVPPADPAALGAAIGRVLDAPHEAAVRAVAAQARLGAEFALAPWLDRHDRLYGSLTATPRSRRGP